MQLTDLTAVQLLDGYRKGEFSPVEATEQALERARRIQPEVNAFARLTGEDALARARESAARWRRGVPGFFARRSRSRCPRSWRSRCRRRSASGRASSAATPSTP